MGKRACFLIGLVLCATASSVSADLVPYHSEAEFQGLLGGSYYLETFDSLLPGSLSNPSYFSDLASGYSFTASTSVDTDPLRIIQDGTAAPTPALSVTGDRSLLILDDLAGVSAAPTAIGGIFYATDSNGTPVSGDVMVTVEMSDMSSFDFVGHGFLGFTSDIGFRSVQVSSSTGEGAIGWPTLDNFYMGATTVPAPGAVVLGAMGLGLVGWRRFAARE